MNTNLTEANDTYTAAAGDHVINGGGGNDTLTVGAGNSTVNVLDGNSTLSLGAGNSTISAGNGNNTITAGAGNSTVTAEGGNNTVALGAGDSNIEVGGGENTITAGAGDSEITTGDGSNTIATGAGDSTIVAGNGSNTIATGEGNSVITAGDGGNTIATGAGINQVTSGSGNDTIATAAGDDIVKGGGGSDKVTTLAGADTLIYVAENNDASSIDLYDGGTGIDTLLLELTQDESTDIDIQTDIENYQAFLASSTGESTGSFTFSSLGLTVNNIEELVVTVAEPVDEEPVVGEPVDEEPVQPVAGEPVDIDDVSTGFEHGFQGWQTMGETSVVASNTGHGHMAMINGQGAAEFVIEDFFEAKIDDNYEGTVGSAIMTTLSLNAGDTISFDYFFQANDYMPYNDFAVYMGTDGEMELLSNIAAVGDYGNSGWQTVTSEINATGVYDVGFAAINALDNILVPELYVDNLQIHSGEG